MAKKKARTAASKKSAAPQEEEVATMETMEAGAEEPGTEEAAPDAGGDELTDEEFQRYIQDQHAAVVPAAAPQPPAAPRPPTSQKPAGWA